MKLNRIEEVDIRAVIARNDRWWRGDLGRPVFNASYYEQSIVSGTGYAPQWFLPAYPRNTPPENILHAEYDRLSQYQYLADGFPLIWMNFGPGVLAAMTGGKGHAAPATVWFGPGKFTGLELHEMSIQFDAQADWSRWLTELYQAAVFLADEKPLVVGMTDIGGVLDVLASLRGSEQLLTDLIDSPDEVKRLATEETSAWIDAFNFFEAVLLQQKTKAYSCWAGILGSGPCYMLQSDFSYMISPDMFAEFVQPELARCCSRLEHGFYHLDGKGQLGHLPRLFNIPGMKGIQWIPGDGQPPQCDWPDVLSAIEDAGLKLQLLGGIDTVEPALRRLKKPELAQVWLNIEPENLEQSIRFMVDFGAE